MMKEDDYMDRLFKDHFENFSPSPSEQVWEGIAANTTMANGKKLGSGAYWRGGMWLGLALLISFGVLRGSQWLGEEHERSLAKMVIPASAVLVDTEALENKGQWSAEAEPVVIAEASNTSFLKAEVRSGFDKVSMVSPSEPSKSSADNSNSAGFQMDSGSESARSAQAMNKAKDAAGALSVPTDHPPTVDGLTADSHLVFDDLLQVNHLYFDQRAQEWQAFNDPLSVKARRDMSRSLLTEEYYQKKKGGHWFVSGYMVADPRLSGDEKFVAGFDGLAFGAGKYLTPNSFVEISLRGAWSNGFNMRATCAYLFLPGRLRPYVQAGLAWGDDVQLRAGIGLLYIPQKMSKWRFFMAANYEGAFKSQEVSRENAGIFEVGAQLRLSGTERVISDNNWMNSIPHYELPTHWYADASVNFSFDAQTKIIHYSAYMGRYVKKRLFVRGGLRADRQNIGIPVQLQYHFLLRQRLRLGVYTGASVALRPGRLGAELGLIAYYDILPKWSLYVAPVFLENSYYTERLFEMGVQFKLSKKK